MVVPKPYRQQLLRVAHDNSGHLSQQRTAVLIKKKFTWPNMTTDIAQYVKSCQSCQSRNKTAHKPCPTQTRPTISEPYEEVAMDIIGPHPRRKGGYKYALTLMCMASRWAQNYPLKQPDTDHVAQALIDFMASP